MSLLFKKQLFTNIKNVTNNFIMKHKYLQGIDRMGICAPWTYYKNNQIFTNMEIKQTALWCNTNYLQEVASWELVPLWTKLIYTTVNLKNFRNLLEANKLIDGNRWYHKNQHPLHDLPQTCGESNRFPQFLYLPLTTWSHTQGQFYGSMKVDPINMINTSQQSTKEGLN